jgi:hypothetical protein
MPDHLFHHHQVAEVGETGGHEASEDMERPPVPHGIHNKTIVTVTDHNTPPDKGREVKAYEKGRDVGHVP